MRFRPPNSRGRSSISISVEDLRAIANRTKKDNDSGALKIAIKKLREALATENLRTVGEWLAKRHQARKPIRARYRETKIQKVDGKSRVEKSYNLYIDRAMGLRCLCWI